MSFPASPQAFSFNGRALEGVTISFVGRTPNRFATHVFPKRDGELREPMGRGGRSLEVELVFRGDDCARRYQAFEADVAANPVGRLVHPIAGRWNAACTGPAYHVNYAEAIDQIKVPVAFLESQLDAQVPSDTPDAATAAQNVTGQQAQAQTSVAAFMLKMGKLQTQAATALNSMDGVLAQVQSGVAQASGLATSTVDLARTTVNKALGFGSNIVGQLTSVAAAADALVADATSFVQFGNIVFDGSSDTPPAGGLDAITAQLGVVQADVATLEAALENLRVASGGPSAASADAVADAEVLADYCGTMLDAIKAAQPRTAKYIVAAPTNLLALAAKLTLDLDLTLIYSAETYAGMLMGLNRIPTPQAIPAGTQLTIPTG